MLDAKRLERLRAHIAASFICAATILGSQAVSAQEFYGPAASNPRIGGTLTMGTLLEPPGLDPYHQAADARIRLTVLMYQGLFYELPSGDAIPLLAESYKVSPDNLVYTIKLRQGVKFHTGQTMTAKDVVYSYNYIRDPKNGSAVAGDFSSVTAVDVVDDHTVKFTLSEPNMALPMTLGNKYGGVIPAGYFDTPDAKNKLNQVSVGTGPFKLAEFKPNSNVMLVKNADYWEKGVPYLDRVNFVFLPSGPSMLVALSNKRVDLAVLTRPQDVKQVERVPGLKVERWPSLNQKALDFGLEYGPLSDVRVRQAIALAVDKDEIMRASIGGLGQTLGTMVAAMQDRWGVPLGDLPNQKVDIKKAQKLLADAGYPGGLELNLTTIIGYEWMDPAAVTLREQLAKISIKLNIQRIDLGVWINNFRSKQMGLTFNDWATQPDPSLLFYRHFHMAPKGADFRNWKNEAASKLLDEGRAESDLSKRKEIYFRFQKELAAQVPTIMLFSADLITVRGDRVQNHVQHPTGWYYGLARTFLAQ